MWTQEQFEAWRHSQVTKDFMMFLNERRESLKEQWAKGSQLSDEDQSIAAIYGDIIDLEWKDVEEFYATEE